MIGRADDTIRIRLILDTSGLKKNLKVIQVETKHIEKTVKRTENSLGGMVSMFGLLAAGMATFGAVKGIIALNSETQNAKASIATLYDALTDASIMDGSAIEVANQQFAELRKGAAFGVGETKDWLEVYSKLLAPGISLGLDSKAMIDLTRQTITAGFAIRGKEGMKLAAMDIPQALGGAANEKVTPIAMRIIEATGRTAKEFNALGRSERMKALIEGFAKFDKGAALMGQTFGAQKDTLLDSLKFLVEEGTKPIFDEWTKNLQRVNMWMVRNKDTIMRVTRQWGANMVAYWKAIRSHAGAYLAIVMTAAAVSGGSNRSMMMRFGNMRMVSRSGGKPSIINALLGGAAASGASAAASGSAAAAGAGAGASLLPLAGVLALLAGVAMALFGAMQEWPLLFAAVIDHAKLLALDIVELVHSFGLMSEEGSLLNMVGAALLTMLLGLTQVLRFMVKVVATVVLAISAMLSGLGRLAEGVWATIIGKKLSAKEQAKDSAQYAKVARDHMSQLDAIWNGRTGVLAAEEKKKDFLGNKKDQVSDTTINVQNMRIEVKTEINEDPVRIASAFEEVVDKMRRHRLQPRRVIGTSLG